MNEILYREVIHSYSFLGRSEARMIFLNRKPAMSSSHFIDQYFTSFESDPIIQKSKNLSISEDTIESLRYVNFN